MLVGDPLQCSSSAPLGIGSDHSVFVLAQSHLPARASRHFLSKRNIEPMSLPIEGSLVPREDDFCHV